MKLKRKQTGRYDATIPWELVAIIVVFLVFIIGSAILFNVLGL
jgi:hypothetical protein